MHVMRDGDNRCGMSKHLRISQAKTFELTLAVRIMTMKVGDQWDASAFAPIYYQSCGGTELSKHCIDLVLRQVLLNCP
jgi:hypothetical protein